MIVASELKSMREAKKNSNFTQTYPKGWRIRELVRDKQRLLLL